MIRKFIVAVAALALATPALAADNKSAKDAAGASFTLRMEDRTSVFYPVHMCVTLADETVDCTAATEALLATTNASLTTIDGRVDGLETAVASTNTKLDTLITDLGTLRTAIGTSASASDCDGSASSMSYQLCAAINLAAIAADTTPLQTYGAAGTATTTITRPADTTAYTANDAFADSTSAPTTGGFTLSGMCRASGGSGVLTDATFIYSTSVAVAGIIYLYDSAPTAQNDNAAWSVSDSDQLKLVGTIPFATVADGANAVHNVQNLNMGYTCVGSANLRYMVKITTGYTPAASDTLTVRAKYVQTN